MDSRDYKVEMVNRGISFSNRISDMGLIKLVKSGKIKATDASVFREMDFLTIFPATKAYESEADNCIRPIL